MTWEIWLSGLAFVLQHSLLASTATKTRAQTLGLGSRGYRLLYVVLALLTTMIWLNYVHGLPDQTVYAIHGPWSGLLRGLQLLGLWMAWEALRPIDGLAFLGIRERQDGPDDFVENGIYRHLRHPVYSGVILIMLGFPLQTQNTLNLYACVTMYFLVGARLEERRLERQHPAYADYRRRVPAFIPICSTFASTRRKTRD